MSKSKGNVVDPWDAIEQFGADAIRWYFVTASQPWVPRGSTRKRSAKHVVAHSTRLRTRTSSTRCTRTSRTGRRRMTLLRPPRVRSSIAGSCRASTRSSPMSSMTSIYEITRAARRVADFIVDDVSNWYVRRSRDRFWGSADAEDTRAAFRTLADTLTTTTRLLAPVTPLVTDWLHRAMTDGDSVHLADFPQANDALRSATLETSMDAVRVLARLGRAARESVKIRVRQPLRVMHAVVPQGVELSEELLEILRDELNVKEVRFLAGAEDLVSYRAVPNFRTLGKRFGPRTQRAADAIRALDSTALGAIRSGAGAVLELDGETFALGLDEVQVHEDAKGELIVEADAGFTIALDPTLDDELRREGLARELVNRIQNLRKKNGLKISDRILLGVFAEPELIDVARVHWDYVAGETLATELVVGGTDETSERFDHRSEVEIEGQRLEIGLKAV